MCNTEDTKSSMSSKMLSRWLGGMIMIIAVIATSQSTSEPTAAGDHFPPKLPTEHSSLEEGANAATPVTVFSEGEGFRVWLPIVWAAPTVSAFPGAEGFGARSVGGRGGRVIEVTNLNDHGPGSLRAAIEAEGSRIVVFRVAGTIELKIPLEITQPFITIAGQTAPGGGITLKNHPSVNDTALIVRTHDVIIRYIRSRPGPTLEKVSDSDAIAIVGNDAYNVIIDHCSFSWGVDEVACTWYDTHDITIQWSIIAEGLHCSTHEKGCHSMGMLIGSDGSGNISIHHNLFAHNRERNPFVKTNGLVDVVNNVIYNPWGTPSVVTDEYGKVPINYVSNSFKRGIDSDPDKYLVSALSSGNSGVEIFVQGNITPDRPRDDMNEWLVVKPDARQWIVTTRHDAPSITTTSAFDAYDQVLAEAGATIGLDSQGNSYWRRDAVDERIVNDVRNGTGKIISDPSEVGGWPGLAVGVAPKDSDHDGMPDAWEEMHDFNSHDPSDGPADADGDEYTNIEEYLNGTDPID
jgi:pectate lyase